MTKHGATGGGHNQLRQIGEAAPRFTTATAAAIGRPEQSIQRDAERGEKIAVPALALVAGTGLDLGGYLDELKTVPAEKQPTSQCCRDRRAQ
jgi:hypothetical protein